MSLRRIAMSLLVAACIAGSASAQPAQPPPAATDVERARLHYANAEQAMQTGAFAEAAREYELSHQLSKDPVLLYKLGVARRNAGDCPGAVPALERYLAEASPDEEFQRLAQDHIAACKSPAGGAGAAGTATAPAGAAAGSGHATGASGAGESSASAVAADAADTPLPASPGEGPPSFLDEPRSWQRDAAWISVGVAIAFGVSGAILGVSASARSDDVNTLIDLRDPLTSLPQRFEGNVRNSYEDLVAEGQSLERLALVGFALAGAATAAAAVFFALDSSAPREAATARGLVHPGRSPARAAAVRPVIGPDTVGVTAGWEF